MTNFPHDYKGFHIRVAEAGDGPRIRALIEPILAEYGLPPDPEGTDSDLSHLSRHYRDDAGLMLLVEDAGGRLVGSGGITRLDGSRCELRKMYLARPARGCGLGQHLLRLLLEAATMRGFTSVTLETASVLTEAIGLYRKHGFGRSVATAESARCDQRWELVLKQGF